MGCEGKILIEKPVSLFFLILLLMTLAISTSTGSEEGFLDSIENEYDSNSVFMWEPSNSIEIGGLALSGDISGTGNSSVYLVYSGEKYLISEDQVNGSTKNISKSCIGTCNLGSFSNEKYIIRVNIQGDVDFSLDTLHYSSSSKGENKKKSSEKLKTVDETVDVEKTGDKKSSSYNKTEMIEKPNIEAGKKVGWFKVVKVQAKDKARVDITDSVPAGASNLSVVGEGGEISPKKTFSSQSNSNELEFHGDFDKGEKKYYTVSYDTPAPKKEESVPKQSENDWKKNVTVSSDIHYKDVLVSTEVKEANEEDIKIYWNFNYTREKELNSTVYNEVLKNISSEREKVLVNDHEIFELKYLDTNNNNLTDKVRWEAPHLSEQSFEVLVSLTTLKANTQVNKNNWTIEFETSAEKANLSFEVLKNSKDLDLRNLFYWDEEDTTWYEVRESTKSGNNITSVWKGDEYPLSEYAKGKIVYDISNLNKYKLNVTFGSNNYKVENNFQYDSITNTLDLDNPLFKVRLCHFNDTFWKCNPAYNSSEDYDLGYFGEDLELENSRVTKFFKIPSEVNVSASSLILTPITNQSIREFDHEFTSTTPFSSGSITDSGLKNLITSYNDLLRVYSSSGQVQWNESLSNDIDDVSSGDISTLDGDEVALVSKDEGVLNVYSGEGSLLNQSSGSFHIVQVEELDRRFKMYNVDDSVGEEMGRIDNNTKQRYYLPNVKATDGSKCNLKSAFNYGGDKEANLILSIENSTYDVNKDQIEESLTKDSLGDVNESFDSYECIGCDYNGLKFSFDYPLTDFRRAKSCYLKTGMYYEGDKQGNLTFDLNNKTYDVDEDMINSSIDPWVYREGDNEPDNYSKLTYKQRYEVSETVNNEYASSCQINTPFNYYGNNDNNISLNVSGTVYDVNEDLITTDNSFMIGNNFTEPEHVGCVGCNDGDTKQRLQLWNHTPTPFPAKRCFVEAPFNYIENKLGNLTFEINDTVYDVNESQIEEDNIINYIPTDGSAEDSHSVGKKNDQLNFNLGFEFPSNIPAEDCYVKTAVCHSGTKSGELEYDITGGGTHKINRSKIEKSCSEGYDWVYEKMKCEDLAQDETLRISCDGCDSDSYYEVKGDSSTGGKYSYYLYDGSSTNLDYDYMIGIFSNTSLEYNWTNTEVNCDDLEKDNNITFQCKGDCYLSNYNLMQDEVSDVREGNSSFYNDGSEWNSLRDSENIVKLNTNSSLRYDKVSTPVSCDLLSKKTNITYSCEDCSNTSHFNLLSDDSTSGSSYTYVDPFDDYWEKINTHHMAEIHISEGDYDWVHTPVECDDLEKGDNVTFKCKDCNSSDNYGLARKELGGESYLWKNGWVKTPFDFMTGLYTNESLAFSLTSTSMNCSKTGNNVTFSCPNCTDTSYYNIIQDNSSSGNSYVYDNGSWSDILSRNDIVRLKYNDPTGNSNILVGDVANNRVYLFNYDDGIRNEWSFDFGNYITALDIGQLDFESSGSEILVGGYGGKAVILNSTGNKVENFSFGDEKISSAYVGEVDYQQRALFGLNDGSLFSCSLEDCSQIETGKSSSIKDIDQGDLTQKEGKETVVSFSDGEVMLFDFRLNKLSTYKVSSGLSDLVIGEFDEFKGNEISVLTEEGVKSMNLREATEITLGLRDYEENISKLNAIRKISIPSHEMNEYLEGCSGLFCDVPLNISSDASSRFNIKRPVVNFTYNASENIDYNLTNMWSERSDFEVGSKLFYEVLNISYTNPSVPLYTKYIDIPGVEGEGNLIFNGKLCPFDDDSNAYLSYCDRDYYIPSSFNRSYDLIWYNTTKELAPVKADKVSYWKGDFYTYNISIYRDTDLTNETFEQVIYSFNINDSKLNTNPRFSVDWFNNGSSYDITPSSLVNCDSSNPEYESRYVNGSEFKVCWEDGDGDSNPDFIKWKQPLVNPKGMNFSNVSYVLEDSFVGSLNVELLEKGEDIFRKNTTNLSAQIFDENNNKLREAGYNCTWYINGGEKGTTKTGDDGVCEYEWNISCESSVSLGGYDVNVSLPDTDTYSGDEDKGKVQLKDDLHLNITKPGNETYDCDTNDTILFEAEAEDSCGTIPDQYKGNVRWKEITSNLTSEVGSGMNLTYEVQEEGGSIPIVLYENYEYYEAVENDTVELLLDQLIKVNILNDEKFYRTTDVNDGSENFSLKAQIYTAQGKPINESAYTDPSDWDNYTCDWYVDGNHEIQTSTKVNEGTCSFNWTTNCSDELGGYDFKVELNNESERNYNYTLEGNVSEKRIDLVDKGYSIDFENPEEGSTFYYGDGVNIDLNLTYSCGGGSTNFSRRIIYKDEDTNKDLGDIDDWYVGGYAYGDANLTVVMDDNDYASKNITNSISVWREVSLQEDIDVPYYTPEESLVNASCSIDVEQAPNLSNYNVTHELGYYHYRPQGDYAIFDGSDDYVDVKGNDSIIENFTVSGWINPDDWNTDIRQETLSVNEDVSSAPLDFGVVGGSKGKLEHYRGNAAGSVMSYDVSSFSGWHHVVITQERTSNSNVDLAMYVDGEQVDSTSGDYENMKLENIHIGAGLDSSDNTKAARFFKGKIDEVSLYNTQLSSSQINDSYERGLKGLRPSKRESLVGYWDFERNDTNYGTWKDKSGLDHETHSYGPYRDEEGKVGDAAEFDGENDYVEVSDDDSLDFGTNSFTISLWKKGYSDDSGLLVKRQDGVGFELSPRDNITSFYIGDDEGDGWHSNIGSTDINDNKWYHIAVTWNGSTNNAIIYVNGNNDGNQTFNSVGSISNSNNLYIGQRFGGSRRFNGSLDQVRIYNKTLIQEEINTTYQRNKDGMESNITDGLVGYWDFENKEDIFDKWSDKSGEENNGSPKNGIDTSEKIGDYVKLDGQDDKIEVNDSDSLDVTDQVTLSAWVKNKAYGSEQNPADSCLSIKNKDDSVEDGIYWIEPEGSDSGPYRVYCDMTTEGGGWTLVASRADDGNDYWTWDNQDNLYNGNSYGIVDNYNTSDYQSHAWDELKGSEVMFMKANDSQKYLVYGDIISDQTLSSMYTSTNETVGEFGPPINVSGNWWQQCNDSGNLMMSLQHNDTDYHNWSQGAKGFIWRSVTEGNPGGCPYDDTWGGLSSANNPDVETGWDRPLFYPQNFNNTAQLVFVRSATIEYPTSQYGDGSDGNLTVSDSETTVNDYTYLTNDESNGENTILVNDTSDFSSGDEVLLIQMQNGSGEGCDAGSYEFKDVDSISGNEIILSSGIDNYYCYNNPNEVSVNCSSNDGFDTSIAQMVRVPQYVNVNVESSSSVTSPPWDGYKGGVVAFRAQGNVSVDGEINVLGDGFRGGENGFNDDNEGGQGEGTSGYGYNPAVEFGDKTWDGVSTCTEDPNNIGGAGSHCVNNNGGDPAGGGGYGTSGESVPQDERKDQDPNKELLIDVNVSEGGNTTGSAEISKMFFGGGGGAGSDNDGHNPEGDGGDGGGIVFISSQSFEGNINATGHRGWGESGVDHSATGGGGAGGTIWVRSQEMDLNTVTAEGGVGVTDGVERSGDGGDGRIRLDYLEKTGDTEPSPGYEGSPYTSESSSTSTSTTSISTSEITTSSTDSNYYNKSVGVEKDEAYGFRLGRNDIVAKINNNTLSNEMQSGWNHVVLTYNKSASSDNQKLYLNGELKQQRNFSEAINITDNDLLIGKDFEGYLDNVIIYNTTLNNTQINTTYQRGKEGLTSNIIEDRIGYWDFENDNLTSGNTEWADKSGNGNDANAIGNVSIIRDGMFWKEKGDLSMNFERKTDSTGTSDLQWDTTGLSGGLHNISCEVSNDEDRYFNTTTPDRIEEPILLPTKLLISSHFMDSREWVLSTCNERYVSKDTVFRNQSDFWHEPTRLFIGANVSIKYGPRDKILTMDEIDVDFNMLKDNKISDRIECTTDLEEFNSRDSLPPQITENAKYQHADVCDNYYNRFVCYEKWKPNSSIEVGKHDLLINASTPSEDWTSQTVNEEATVKGIFYSNFTHPKDGDKYWSDENMTINLSVKDDTGREINQSDDYKVSYNYDMYHSCEGTQFFNIPQKSKEFNIWENIDYGHDYYRARNVDFSLKAYSKYYADDSRHSPYDKLITQYNPEISGCEFMYNPQWDIRLDPKIFHKSKVSMTHPTDDTTEYNLSTGMANFTCRVKRLVDGRSSPSGNEVFFKCSDCNASVNQGWKSELTDYNGEVDFQINMSNEKVGEIYNLTCLYNYTLNYSDESNRYRVQDVQEYGNDTRDIKIVENLGSGGGDCDYDGVCEPGDGETCMSCPDDCDFEEWLYEEGYGGNSSDTDDHGCYCINRAGTETFEYEYPSSPDDPATNITDGQCGKYDTDYNIYEHPTRCNDCTQSNTEPTISYLRSDKNFTEPADDSDSIVRPNTDLYIKTLVDDEDNASSLDVWWENEKGSSGDMVFTTEFEEYSDEYYFNYYHDLPSVSDNYTFTIYAEDSTGKKSSSKIDIYVDDSVPEIKSIEFTNGEEIKGKTYYSPDDTVELKVTLGEDDELIKYVNADDQALYYAGGESWDRTFEAQDTDHNFSIEVEDEAEHSVNGSKKYYIDNEAPSVNITNPPNGAFYSSNQDVDLVADISDELGKNSTYQANLNGDGWNDLIHERGNLWKNTFTLSSEGWNIFEAKAEDYAGNINYSYLGVYLDTQPPSISNVGIQQDNNVVRSDATIDLSADIDDRRFSYSEISNDNSYELERNWNNIYDDGTIKIDIDEDRVSDWTDSSGSVTLDKGDFFVIWGSLSKGDIDFSGDFAPANPPYTNVSGTNYVYEVYRKGDVSGTYGDAKFVEISSINDVSTVTHSGTPSELGCNTDGSCSLTIYANDTLGHESTDSYNLVIDDTPPNLENFTLGGDNFYVNSGDDVDFYIDVSDDNLDWVELEGNRMSDSGGNTYRITEKPDNLGCSSGNCELNFTAKDEAGNKNNVIETIEIDNTPPESSYTQNTPEDGTIKSDENWIFVEANVSEENIKNVTFNLINEETYSITSTGILSNNFTNLEPNGYYEFKVNAVDKAGNENTTPIWSVTIDSKPPYISLGLDGGEDKIVRSDQGLTFRTTTSDESGIENATLNEILMNYQGDNSDGEEIWTLDNTTEGVGCTTSSGICQINSTSRDNAGNKNKTSINLTIDDTNPKIYNLTVNESGWMKSDVDLNISVNVVDNHTDFVNVGHTVDINMVNGSGNEWYGETTPEEIGCNYSGECPITVTASDKADNTNSTVTSLKVDTNSPNVTLLKPENETDFRSEDYIYVESKIEEYESSISEVTFKLYNYSTGDYMTQIENDIQLNDNYSIENHTFNNLDPNAKYGASVTSEDEAGNLDSSEVHDVILDSIPPELINYTVNDSDRLVRYTAPLRINVTFSDANPEPPELNDVTMNHSEGDLWTRVTSAKELGADDSGTSEIDIKLEDKAGNTNYNHSFNLTVDDHPPRIHDFTIDDPTGDKIVKPDDKYTFTLEFEERNVESVKINGTSMDYEYSINESYHVYKLDERPTNFNCNNNDYCLLNARVVDKVGKENSTNMTLFVDDIPPAIQYSNNDDKDNIVTRNQTVCFDLVVNENRGLDFVKFGDTKQLMNVEDKPGYFDFDGEDDYVDVSYDDTNMKSYSNLTMMGWVKTGDLFSGYVTSIAPLIMTSNEGKEQYALGYTSRGSSENRFAFYTRSGDSTHQQWVYSDTVVEKYAWYHITMTQNDDNVSLYVNGELQTTENLNIIPEIKDGDKTYIGRIIGERNGYLNGSIDEVAVFERELNQTEIEGLAGSRFGKVDEESSVNDSLVSYWPLDDYVYDKSTSDVSVNDYDGDLFGGVEGHHIAERCTTPDTLGCTDTINDECEFITEVSDYASNKNTSFTFNLTIDEHPPYINNLTPSGDGIVTSSEKVNFSVKANDEHLKGVSLNGTEMSQHFYYNDTYTLKTNVSALGCPSNETEHKNCTLTAESWDATDNKNTTDYTIEVDDVPPNVSNLNVTNAEEGTSGTNGTPYVMESWEAYFEVDSFAPDGDEIRRVSLNLPDCDVCNSTTMNFTKGEGDKFVNVSFKPENYNITNGTHVFTANSTDIRGNSQYTNTSLYVASNKPLIEDIESDDDDDTSSTSVKYNEDLNGFSASSSYTDPVEIYKNTTISFTIISAPDLTKVNVSIISRDYNASYTPEKNESGLYEYRDFSLDVIPKDSGWYNVSIFARNEYNGENTVLKENLFLAVGQTDTELTREVVSANGCNSSLVCSNISKNNSANITFRFNFTNNGNISLYESEILPLRNTEGISYSPLEYGCGNLGEGEKCSTNVTLTVDANAGPDTYNIDMVGQFLNADNTTDFGYNQEDLKVLSNPELELGNNTIEDHNVSYRESKYIGETEILAVGNQDLKNVNITEIEGDIDPTRLVFEPSSMNVNKLSKRNVRVNVTEIPRRGNLYGRFNISAYNDACEGDKCWSTLDVNLSVYDELNLSLLNISSKKIYRDEGKNDGPYNITFKVGAKARAEEDYTSDYRPQENVTIHIYGSYIGNCTTNSSGECIFTWEADPSFLAGEHNINIQGEEGDFTTSSSSFNTSSITIYAHSSPGWLNEEGEMTLDGSEELRCAVNDTNNGTRISNYSAQMWSLKPVTFNKKVFNSSSNWTNLDENGNFTLENGSINIITNSSHEIGLNETLTLSGFDLLEVNISSLTNNTNWSLKYTNSSDETEYLVEESNLTGLNRTITNLTLKNLTFEIETSLDNGSVSLESINLSQEVNYTDAYEIGNFSFVAENNSNLSGDMENINYSTNLSDESEGWYIDDANISLSNKSIASLSNDSIQGERSLALNIENLTSNNSVEVIMKKAQNLSPYRRATFRTKLKECDEGVNLSFRVSMENCDYTYPIDCGNNWSYHQPLLEKFETECGTGSLRNVEELEWDIKNTNMTENYQGEFYLDSVRLMSPIKTNSSGVASAEWYPREERAYRLMCNISDEQYYNASPSEDIIIQNITDLGGGDGEGEDEGGEENDSEEEDQTDSTSGGGGGGSSGDEIESVCGDGKCAADETRESCPQDCDPTLRVQSECGDGECGLGESIFNCPQDCAEKQPFKIEHDINNPEIFAGENQTFSLDILNQLQRKINPKLSVNNEELEKFISYPEETRISSLKEKRVPVVISVPSGEDPGVYSGDMIVEWEDHKTSLPITLTTSESKEEGFKARLNLMKKQYEPQGVLKAHLSFYSPTVEKKTVHLQYIIRDALTDEVVKRINETVEMDSVKTKTLEIPLNFSWPMERMSPGGEVYATEVSSKPVNYLIEVRANTSLESSSDLERFSVYSSFWTRGRILTLVFSLTTLSLFSLMVYGGYKYRKIKKSKARYVFPTNYNLLPQKSDKALWLGKIAGTKKDAWMNRKDLLTHVLTAGATGSGKSVSASVIVEEVLKKKIPVVVFDPTAQWTGFVKSCEDPKLLKFYKQFKMKKLDAHSFKGLIYDVDTPNIKPEFKKYMNPGEVTVFNLRKLEPGQYDTAVRNIIQTIFNQQWEEATDLKMLVVFDEVHRLLEKYGGKGGYIALEKACREFRKWGIGVMMASQVNADFKEAVQGNILTEVQLNTKAVEDIKKMEKKYGKEYARRISSEGVGTAMVQHPKYNKGKPWFVQFRPTLHSPHKIPEEDLKKYDEYTTQLTKIEKQIENLKKNGKDVTDINLELKLAKDKLSQGHFKMAKIYLDSLNESLKHYK